MMVNHNRLSDELTNTCSGRVPDVVKTVSGDDCTSPTVTVVTAGETYTYISIYIHLCGCVIMFYCSVFNFRNGDENHLERSLTRPLNAP